jgi:hypothetical protein
MFNIGLYILNMLYVCVHTYIYTKIDTLHLHYIISGSLYLRAKINFYISPYIFTPLTDGENQYMTRLSYEYYRLWV